VITAYFNSMGKSTQHRGIRKVVSTQLPTAFGVFDLIGFQEANNVKRDRETVLVMMLGDLEGRVPLLRIHSQCLTGEVLGSLRCDCRGQLEVALFTAETTDQYREAMFNALTDIDRLSQIVRALLLLSQAESGQIILQKSRLNLCDVVDDLVEQFQIPAEAAGVRLTAELPEECSAEVDRVQIERMITNLLSNALKFTPEGGQVTMSLQVQPTFVEMVVEDNGRGIPTEHLPHIFDRFYRVPGKGTAPSPEQGLGLGLSFVAWIVKAHNGKIEVESTPGKGTRFIIRLPNEGVGSDTMELVGVA